MTLDFTALSKQELAAYFGEGDLRHIAGYRDYEREFQDSKYKDRLDTLFENTSGPLHVLELGGARGHRGVHALQNIPSVDRWDVFDIYQSDHNLVMDRLLYHDGDALTLASVTPTNRYDLAVSFRFMECIPERKLPVLIEEINRISKKQIHVIGMEHKNGYYIPYEMNWWKVMGFNKGTKLLSFKDYQNGRFDMAEVV